MRSGLGMGLCVRTSLRMRQGSPVGVVVGLVLLPPHCINPLLLCGVGWVVDIEVTVTLFVFVCECVRVCVCVCVCV